MELIALQRQNQKINKQGHRAMYTYVIRQFTILTLFDKKVHLQQTATIYKVSLQGRLILAKKVL